MACAVPTRRAATLAGSRPAPPRHGKKKRDTRRGAGCRGCCLGSALLGTLVEERPFRCKVQEHSSQIVLNTSFTLCCWQFCSSRSDPRQRIRTGAGLAHRPAFADNRPGFVAPLPEDLPLCPPAPCLCSSGGRPGEAGQCCRLLLLRFLADRPSGVV